jgi:quinoprotein glucose dehydrogenase
VSRAEGPIATLTRGTQAAATNWPGGSYDPETHTVFVASQTSIATLGLMPAPPGTSDMPYFQGTVLTGARLTGGSGAGAGAGAVPGPGTPAAGRGGRGEAPAAAAPGGGRGTAPTAPAAGGGGRGSGEGGGGGGGALSVQGLPLVKPPYSRITAIDMDRGEFRWVVPFGATPDNIRNHPALKGLNLGPLGRPGNNTGTLVTKTLLIAGEGNFGPTPSGQRGAMLRAFDKSTGKEVGAVYMPAPQSGSPMTYMFNGRQYIVIAISGAGYSGELMALRVGS